MTRNTMPFERYGVSMLLLLFLVLMPLPVFSGNLYECTGEGGEKVLTDVPKDNMKCRVVETFKDMTASEKEAYSKSRQEYHQQKEEEYQRERAIEESRIKREECIQTAQKKFEENWAAGCTVVNLPPQCDLIEEKAGPLKKILEDEKKKCQESYPAAP